MSLVVDDTDFTLYVGDVRDVLATMPDESVHCVVTSPPYWGLRDYGTGLWDGGDADCDHTTARSRGEDIRPGDKQGTSAGSRPNTLTVCPCGARRTDKQLGLESTADEYVANMVAVFRDVKRVLRRDGTCWLNIGDSYAGGKQGRADGERMGSGGFGGGPIATKFAGMDNHQQPVPVGLKPKDLVGIPWRLAFALQQPYYTGRIKDERDRIWLAAMIDAEGCMFIHKRKAGADSGAKFTKKDGTEMSYSRKQDTYGSGLEISSTDRVIVERCMEIAGIGSICEQSPTQNDRRKQTLYRWNLRTNECRDIVREVYPHLVAKQHEARLLIGCPSSGADAEKAHTSLKAIHNGQTPDIDFKAPESMWEPGWYVRADVIWSKPQPDA